MQDKALLKIVCSDDKSRRVIEKTLQTEGLIEKCTLVANDEPGAPVHFRITAVAADEAEDFAGQVLSWPVRLGHLVDRVRMMITRQSDDAAYKIGPYILKPSQLILSRDAGEPIKLTEKEAEILKILSIQDGQSISRQELMDLVWGYAEGVETHTLETHLYRLRQKIEQDPSDPQILLTEESGGYRLAA